MDDSGDSTAETITVGDYLKKYWGEQLDRVACKHPGSKVCLDIKNKTATNICKTCEELATGAASA